MFDGKLDVAVLVVVLQAAGNGAEKPKERESQGRAATGFGRKTRPQRANQDADKTRVNRPAKHRRFSFCSGKGKGESFGYFCYFRFVGL